ncbi:MAG TPA: HmuY family protein [Chitinophaga sp.]|uniref:HmuY family protein n=1 Tax=Chitinophaga sp. TaxID=1869181 RepID=UPI002DBFA804|nr:HmuY family protein [Chitinophaga sp.]HEU4555866.1 HmuY family protein [Chitinophaga sp.]
MYTKKQSQWQRMRRVLFSLTLIAALGACSNDDDTAPVIPPSDGASMKLDGGGGTGAPNAVYVDFSADKQTAVARTGWDLGFYSGGDYRVILNYTSSMAVKALDKTDITQAGLDDTTGISLALGQGAGTLDMVDDVYGSLSKTAIAAVNAADAANRVYLVKPETASATDPATWYKIKISRNGNGYRLQYALLAATAIQTADISKDTRFNFTFYSFTGNKVVSVEPEKAAWDIQWSYGVYFAGSGTAVIPYLFSDFVFSNSLAGVQAAEATTADGFNYDTFAAADLTSSKLVFTATRDAIGSKWRATAGATLGIKTDRFYIVKDTGGNYYKLKFVSAGIGQDGGQRGYPEIAYKLIK